MKTTGLIALLIASAVGCAAPGEAPPLASAHSAPDFDTYELRRVGLLPLLGRDLIPEHTAALQDALTQELSRVAPYEIVELRERDVAEVVESEPHRRGWYSPKTILELSRRYRLDGLLVGTVTQHQSFPPLAIGMDFELVSTETGLVIWSSSVSLDASDARVRQSIERYQLERAPGAELREATQLMLLSPERFGRFAAHELSRVL